MAGWITQKCKILILNTLKIKDNQKVEALLESFYYWNTLIFGIAIAFVSQLEVNYKLDRLLIVLSSQIAIQIKQLYIILLIIKDRYGLQSYNNFNCYSMEIIYFGSWTTFWSHNQS